MARTYSDFRTRYSTGKTERLGTARTRRSSTPARVSRRSPAPIIVIAMLVAVVILLWVFGKGCQSAREATENDRLKSYTGEVNDLSGRSSALGAQFSQIANSPKSYSRTDLDAQLEQIETDCKVLAAESSKLSCPSKAGDLQSLARTAYQMRAEGVNTYQVAILALLNGGDRSSASSGVSKGLQDLLVSDEMLQRYRAGLGKQLEEAEISAEIIDPGRFVASIDCCSSASVNAYIDSIVAPPAPAARNVTPAAAMKAYLKSKGTDYSSMSFEVVSESGIDPSWKVDVATAPGKQPLYFLLHGANGAWTVLKSGVTMTPAEMKAAGAPADLKAPGQAASP